MDEAQGLVTEPADGSNVGDADHDIWTRQGDSWHFEDRVLSWENLRRIHGPLYLVRDGAEDAP